MTEPEPEALAALKRIPLLAQEPAEKLSTERLGGLTNRNYKITAPVASAMCCAYPARRPSDYINRKIEAHNASVAAAAKRQCRGAVLRRERRADALPLSRRHGFHDAGAVP